MYSLMNLFGDLRGLESVRNFILCDETTANNSIIPILYLDSLLQSLKYFYERCNSNLATEILDMVKNAVELRLVGISEGEIRNLNTTHIMNLISTLKIYLAKRSNCKLAEQLELMVAKKLLN